MGKDMKGGVQREVSSYFGGRVAQIDPEWYVGHSAQDDMQALTFESGTDSGQILAFSSELHFYDLASSLDEDQDPKICVVSDVGDPFSALPTNRWM